MDNYQTFFLMCSGSYSQVSLNHALTKLIEGILFSNSFHASSSLLHNRRTALSQWALLPRHRSLLNPCPFE